MSETTTHTDEHVVCGHQGHITYLKACEECFDKWPCKTEMSARLAAAEARAAAAEARGDFWKSAAFNGERDTANQRAARHAAEQARDAERARADVAVAALRCLSNCSDQEGGWCFCSDDIDPNDGFGHQTTCENTRAILAAQQWAEGQPAEGRAP